MNASLQELAHGKGGHYHRSVLFRFCLRGNSAGVAPATGSTGRNFSPVGRAPACGFKVGREIEAAARGVEGVVGTNTLRAHYVGPFIHVELHVEVAKDISTLASHEICVRVEEAIEAIEVIDKSFIHIDPV